MMFLQTKTNVIWLICDIKKIALITANMAKMVFYSTKLVQKNRI